MSLTATTLDKRTFDVALVRRTLEVDDLAASYQATRINVEAPDPRPRYDARAGSAEKRRNLRTRVENRSDGDDGLASDPVR